MGLNEKLFKQNHELLYEQQSIEHFISNALSLSYLDPRYIDFHLPPMSAFNGGILLVKIGPNGGIYLLLRDFTGGMPDLFWIDPTGELKGALRSQRMQLGILPDKQFNRNTEMLAPEKGD